ncbi:PREDICTED: HLA class II histocompatibility antigen, DM alpha chain isoform X2 [Rhinopithecus bieti]|uniref:HLA class II histocompatibility antigen, DM alpha chain isoform X2 n=1 Tax=Rhinopithecus bieti TaxID=61621 RepID=UPI00083BDA09|nr:PREDICTED: HLA class II histocompatibility antigen, DM alpha chain isoform X2 [Rhinopithecus bieti]
MGHEQNQGAALLQMLPLLWLLPHSWAVPEAPTPVWRDDLQNHTFLHTVYCQDGSPSMGLSEAYDEDQLFFFDFSQNTRVPRLPEFADWAQEQGDAPAILFDKAFCELMIQQVGPQLDGKIPVSRVNWQHHSVPVEGSGPTFVSAVDGLSFQAFSYLNITPEPSDIFSCIVTHEIDRYTAIAYWVPQNALPSDLLENVLCGVAFGLGVLGIIVGIVLIIYFRKPCSGD